MKTSHLVGLALALAALLVVGALLRSRARPGGEAVEEQVRLRRLVGDQYTEANARRIVLTVGQPGDAAKDAPDGDADEHAGHGHDADAPEDKPAPAYAEMRIEKDDAGRWTVPTSWNAPANAEQVNRLLDALRALKGDLQAESASSHAALGVDDAHAARVRVETADGAATVLVGGRPGGAWDETFVRLVGEDTVYRVAADVRRDAGFSGDAPNAESWLDLTLAQVPADAAERLSLSTPDRKVAFARAAPEAAETPEGEDETAPPPPAPRPWQVAEGGTEDEFNAATLDKLLRELAPLKAKNAVDPAKRADWGLDAPACVLAVGRADGSEFTLTVGKKDDAYYAEASTRPGLVYEMPSWKMENLLPKGGALFALQGPRVTPAETTFLQLRRGAHALSLARDGDAWRVADGGGYPLADGEPAQWLDRLSLWKPDDYADAAEPGRFGLVEPEAVAQAMDAEDGLRTFRLGGAAAQRDARYVGVADGGPVLVAGAEAAGLLFPAWASLLRLKPFADGAAVTAVKRGDWTLSWEDVEGENGATTRTWRVRVADGKDGRIETVDAARAADYVALMADLEGMDLADASGLAFDPADTLTVTVDGRTATLAFAAAEAESETRVLRLADRPALAVPSFVADQLLLTAEAWLPAPEAPAPAETPDAEVPAAEADAAEATGEIEAPAPEAPAAPEAKPAPKAMDEALAEED